MAKLWLDDVRKCPFVGGWYVATNYDEAIQILGSMEIEEAWLDHDLAYEHYGHVDPSSYKEKTGYDVVLWMFENGTFPKKCFVHSLNPDGSRRMCIALAKHYGGTPIGLDHRIPYLDLMKNIRP